MSGKSVQVGVIKVSASSIGNGAMTVLHWTLIFLLLEYDHGRPVALVEYKHEDANPRLTAHPSLLAIKNLADQAGIPAFVVRYADDFSWWYPISLNSKARELYSEKRKLSEREWVELLYRCRGRKLPVDLDFA